MNNVSGTTDTALSLIEARDTLRKAGWAPVSDGSFVKDEDRAGTLSTMGQVRVWVERGNVRRVRDVLTRESLRAAIRQVVDGSWSYSDTFVRSL